MGSLTKRFRSAITGRFVTKAETERDPDRTIIEARDFVAQCPRCGYVGPMSRPHNDQHADQTLH